MKRDESMKETKWNDESRDVDRDITRQRFSEWLGN